VRRLLLIALIASLGPAASARASSAPAWGGISDRIGGAMQQLQQPDGSLSEYLSGTPQPYGEAMVGYGLLLRGVRTGDQRAVEAGLRGVSYSVQPGLRAGPGLDSVFKQLGVAAAYALADEQLTGDERFESRREGWAAWLRQVRAVHLYSPARGTSNKHLVEAVAQLELLRSGISPGEPGTVLADPAGTRERVEALINGRWPAAVAAQSRRGPLGPMAVSSDAPTHPLAYHALALAMADRAVTLLGTDAEPAARDALARMARASWALTAPDGDLAYWGRSQEQSWALALTAAGAGALARGGDDGRATTAAGAGALARGGDDGRAAAATAADARRAEALRSRLAGRVVAVHGFGPHGVWIVPSLRTDPAAGRAAMDDYAANGVYNGLTLVGAEWTLNSLATAEPSATGALGGDRDGTAAIGRGLASFAVSRHRNVWFAVRMRSGFGGHSHDPRYAFGLMAAKRRTAAGWTDVVPAAPRSLAAGDAPGPWLVLPSGRVAEPFGTRIETDRRSGTVTVVGGFRTAGGAVVRRVRFTYTPAGRGVELSFRVRTGDDVEVADFRRDNLPPTPPALTLARRNGTPRAVRSTPLVRSGFASATLGRVVRVAVRVRAAHGGTLTWAPSGR
jgi:hypothetical protein